MRRGKRGAALLLGAAVLADCDGAPRADQAAVQSAERAADAAGGGEFDGFRTVPGTRHLWAAVRGRREAGGGILSTSGYGGEYTPARNYVFYDADTPADAGAVRWLLPAEPPGAPPRQLKPHLLVVAATPAATAADVSAAAASAAGTPADADPSESRTSAGVPAVVRAILYEVRERDTNGNGRLDSDDRAVLASSAPTGEAYRVLLPDIRRYLGTFWRGDGSAVVLYAGPGGPRAAAVDAGARRVVRDAPLPGAPPH